MMNYHGNNETGFQSTAPMLYPIFHNRRRRRMKRTVKKIKSAREERLKQIVKMRKRKIFRFSVLKKG